MRSILLLAAAAVGLLCALGKPSESVEPPTEPGSFQAWAKAEADRLGVSQAIQTADAPARATPREAETPAEPADEEVEIAPWEEPPDESPPTIKWEGAPPEQVNGVWHRRSKMIVPPELDAGEALPQPGDKTMTPEYLDRPGVIDGRTQPSAAYGSKVCPCGNCQCRPDCQCPKGTVLTQDVGRGRLPRLRVTVWDKGCTRCVAFEKGALAELTDDVGAPAWTVGGPECQIELVTIPGDEDAPPAPLFEYVTSDGIAASWVGYTTRDDFTSRLRRAMGLEFEPKTTTGPVPPTNSVVTGDVGWHSHRCVCGTIWSHDGSGEHYAAHTCPSCGRYENEVYQGQPAMQTRGTYYTPAVRQRGFFGRVFNRSGCANGACGR